MRFVLILFCFFTLTVNAQVDVFDKFDEFQKKHLTDLNPDTTYVINFWATWCVPCVRELPYFEELTEKYDNKPVKVILVSLDMKSQLSGKLLPFIKKKKIKSKVIVLADGKTNSWIDLIDPEWSGAIPATLIFTHGERFFFEKSYHSFEELENEIKNTQSKN